MNTSLNLRRFTQISVLVAIMIILSFTPLGYVPLFGLNATTMHIPVILGACLFGPRIGGLLGLLFGITSVVRATVQPNITSFVFTPFYSLSPEFSGGFSSLIVAIGPRVLIGIISGYLFLFLVRRFNKVLALAVTGLVGSMVNTVGVLSLIYIFFGSSFAEAIDKPINMLMTIIMGIVMTNGIAEAIVAAIVNTALYQALAKIFRFKN